MMNRRRLDRARPAALGLGCAALLASLLVGCSGERNRLAEFRDEPTPDLATMHERHDDVENLSTIIKDEHGRMFYRDLRYFWLLDRPSRLRPEPSAW
jgi:hypothetical protein